MRAFVIFARFLPLLLSFLRDHRRWIVRGAPLERSDAFHRARAGRLVRTVGGLGPTFVKFAQVFASRPDLVAEPYVTALATLTDRVPPVPVEQVRAVILESYGQSVEALFDRFDDVPVAAASLGQVHRASWKGREVAVKVLRPGVEHMVSSDIAAARRILAFVEPRFSSPHVRGLRPVIDEFAERIADEMDFRREAEYAREIRANFAAEPRVAIPEVVDEMTRQRVLVLEFMEGRRIDGLADWIAEGRVSASRLTATVIELYIQMMLIDGLFHADPHPGNLLVAPDGRLVLLDFGMVVRVPIETRRKLIAAVYAAIRRDVDGVVAGFYGLGLVEPAVERARIHELVGVLLQLAYSDLTNAERAQHVAGQVMAELHEWPVVLPREMVYFARAASLVEGIGARYDARFNAITFAAPIALRLRGRVNAVLGTGERRTAPDDWMGEAGGLLGEVAGVVMRAGRELAVVLGKRLVAGV